MSYGVIYAVHNSVNDKLYVGQTIRPLIIRWRAHCRPSTARKSHGIISKAIQKYGKEKFTVAEISRAGNRPSLDNLEMCWIILLQSWRDRFGYNLTMGGETGPSEETRKKLCGRKQTPEERARRGLAGVGRKHTVETKMKMATARRNFWARKTPEEKMAILRISHQSFQKYREEKRRLKCMSNGDSNQNMGMPSLLS